MNRDIRNNLILAALVVSLVVHVGVVIWAKPKVMTHVTAGIVRVVRHGPMRVSSHAERPEPVPVEVVRDEKAKTDAPKHEQTAAILPSDETALPEAPKQATALPQAAAPEVLTQLAPDETMPKVDVSRIEATTWAPPTPKMSFDAPAVVQSGQPSLTLAMPGDVAAAPVFEAPVFSPVANIRERTQPETVKIETPKTPPKETFKPVAEVMPEVDEKIVTREKDAVRELLNSASALDLCAVADGTLATQTEGSYTYFRATVRPKSRLPNVSKDVVILIDASGSIGYDRLSSCRKHAKEILRTAMNSGDRFNLVAFRDKFSYCFKTWQTCDAASFSAADKWMMRLAAHGRTDVFATIASVLTLPRDPVRPLIALVVTDGDANAGVSATAQILAKFSRLNDGLVSVYMYGVKSSANRELIDVLTHGNRGESFIFDGWRWNAGEGIGAFSERFRDPLVTDLRVVFPSTQPAEVYPGLLKNLYRGNSIELVGRVAGRPSEISFSLRGIAGSLAYEGFFRLPVRTARADANLPAVWRAERQLDAKLR